MHRSLASHEFCETFRPVIEGVHKSTIFEMVETESVPFLGALQPHRHFRILMVDQLLARIAAAGADESIEHQLEIAGRTIPVDWCDDGPCVRDVEPGVQVEIPHEVRLVRTIPLVAVARPDAECHRRRYTSVAALDPGALVEVAKVFQVDFELLRELRFHSQGEAPRLRIDARAAVLPPVRSGDQQNADWPSLRRKVAVAVIGSHVLPLLAWGLQYADARSVTVHVARTEIGATQC